MRTKNVIVLPYNVAWKSAFEDIKKEIENAIGDLIVGIEHVGSTAVEGLSAKPCIDIDVVIKDYSVFQIVVQNLEAIGYIHEGNLGIKDREAFQYRNKPHLQMHHLYVCPQESEELHRHITFRDYLRNHSDAIQKYSLVKETAAKLFPNDIDKYMEYKSHCIEELYMNCGLKQNKK
ncbi:MAG: GrpB family protein [Oscillospiraceae bacterium]|nr:GrpB family protein [Oscillospiraceae bacterium]